MGNKVLVGISVYRDAEHLQMLLQSIRWYTRLQEPFDLVVCDDGTRTRDHIMAERIRYITEKYGAAYVEHSENKGIPSAWNTIARCATENTEIVVILNDDLLVVPNWLRVAVHFLRENKDNPQLGTVFWQPHQPFNKDVMRVILPLLGHTLFESRDQVTNKDNKHIFDAKQGEGHGLGRVMCPCGCCFAFRKEVFEMVGGFDERLTSFHEESDFGTKLAAIGRGSYALPYPRPYHAHGKTFGECPELMASQRMRESRKLYRDKWNVPSNVGPTEYFNYVNEQLMPNIPEVEWKFLSPDYSAEPEEFTLPGGEIVKSPKLIEKVWKG